jgi:fluoride exporter
MPGLLLVMLGGAVGAALRYELGRAATDRIGDSFPWGTLTINLIGGLLMGALVGWLLHLGPAGRPIWTLLGVGVLGGFTTFSAFALEIWVMLERGDIAYAAGYAAASVVGSVLLLFVGLALARAAA